MQRQTNIGFNNNWTCNGKPVTLPHDAQISEKRGKDVSNGGHGYFPGGVYTYEKTFTAPREWEGKDILAEFEGVYKNATVSLNGKELCFHPYGYTGFFVELKGLNYGGENTLTVVADNSKLPNSRWYSGSGIYRPVWLHVCEKGGLRPESVKISTVSIDPAVIRIEAPVSVKAEVEGITGEGTSFELTIPNAKLWSDETPYLYTAKITAGEGDTVEIPFGIRQITWSNKGLFINGKETLLRGGCVHHDSGILGAATYAESEERRVRILKENGFNAIRSAHNPCSKAMLDACDRLGMYVMDETFDMWYNRKNPYDYGADFEKCWEADVTSMVERDFNHPSVILYSIGNEVGEPAEAKGLDYGKKMIELCHKLDASRPVTCGANLMIMGRTAKGNALYKDGEQPGGEQKPQKEKDGNASLMFNIIASFVGLRHEQERQLQEDRRRDHALPGRAGHRGLQLRLRPLSAGGEGAPEPRGLRLRDLPAGYLEELADGEEVPLSGGRLHVDQLGLSGRGRHRRLELHRRHALQPPLSLDPGRRRRHRHSRHPGRQLQVYLHGLGTGAESRHRGAPGEPPRRARVEVHLARHQRDPFLELGRLRGQQGRGGGLLRPGAGGAAHQRQIRRQAESERVQDALQGQVRPRHGHGGGL